MEQELEKISGTVEDVTYHNEESGFTVLLVDVDGDPVTVVGEVPEIAEGEEITATGNYKVHGTYGVQFRAELIERTLPATAGAIRKYLSSGAVKGLGPALAGRIVARFGDDTLTIIEKEPERLTEVRGISAEKARKIGEEYQRQFGIRSVMSLLASLGLPAATAIKAWRRWGANTADVLKSDPYALCCEEIGVEFEEADRMAEITGREASTIHRLLEVEPKTEVLTFKRGEKNPLPADAVIVDEMSMVDTLLMEHLLRGMRLGARLIMVGDSDQLPSVSAGNVLRDLIQSGLVPCIHLERVFRQAAESLIVTNAHAIVRGEMPDLGCRTGDFFFLEQPDAFAQQRLVVDLVSRRLPKSYGYDPLRDIQVITPAKQGPLGTRELNRLLQGKLNPPERGKGEATLMGRTLREGDKVMQIRNNYDIIWQQPDGTAGTGIFNGDMGIIEMLDPGSKTIQVRFEEKLATYSFENQDQLEHAYAVTVHKSQGSEFEAVVMPLERRHPKLHYRNLLYTAVTRARKLLIMTGQKETVYAMVQNNRRTLRYTNQKEMLQEMCDE